MNEISFFFIFLFGLLFGFVFPSLLSELGFDRKLKENLLNGLVVVAILPFISFIVFLIHPIFVSGSFSFGDMSLFSSLYDGVFIWMTFALLIGGAARLGLDYYKPGAF